jgi:hypothetical protein
MFELLLFRLRRPLLVLVNEKQMLTQAKLVFKDVKSKSTVLSDAVSNEQQ